MRPGVQNKGEDLEGTVTDTMEDIFSLSDYEEDGMCFKPITNAGKRVVGEECRPSRKRVVVTKATTTTHDITDGESEGELRRRSMELEQSRSCKRRRNSNSSMEAIEAVPPSRSRRRVGGHGQRDATCAVM